MSPHGRPHTLKSGWGWGGEMVQGTGEQEREGTGFGMQNKIFFFFFKVMAGVKHSSVVGRALPYDYETLGLIHTPFLTKS